MKTLTATNQRVQQYLTLVVEKPDREVKVARMTMLEEGLASKNIMLDELFKAKKLDVLDYILYITSATGISKVGAEKIAEKCNCGIRTVYEAVKSLKSTGEFIVARLIKNAGGAGKYIFVDKKHFNFKEIMKQVFSLSDSEIAEQVAVEVAGQKTPESLDTVSVEAEKTTSNYNSFSKKHATAYYSNLFNQYMLCNVMQEAVKVEVEKEVKANNSREYVVEYASNQLQIDFYDFLDSFPLPKPMEAVKGILALRIGSDATEETFVKATKLISHMATRISKGYVYDNVTASFTGGLTKAMGYEKPVPVKSRLEEWINETKTKATPKVPFYNWLEERE